MQFSDGRPEDKQEILFLTGLLVGKADRLQGRIEGLDMGLDEVDIGYNVIGLSLQLDQQVVLVDHMCPANSYLLDRVLCYMEFDRSLWTQSLAF